nr:MAG TPA: hypothetical protein [Caudoviricetes sp.]
MTHLINLTDEYTRVPTLTRIAGDYDRYKEWFALVPGFNAYDAAKWAQRVMRALHGDRTALSQLEDAGFALTVY